MQSTSLEVNVTVKQKSSSISLKLSYH